MGCLAMLKLPHILLLLLGHFHPMPVNIRVRLSTISRKKGTSMELRLKPNRSIFELTGKKTVSSYIRVRGFAKSNLVKETHSIGWISGS